MKKKVTENIYMRASACIFDSENNILLVRENDDKYWILPGGGVENNESSLDAVVREVEEELGVVVCRDDIDLINITENFFTLNSNDIHEINFIFTCSVGENLKIVLEENVKRELCWLSVNEIEALDVMPLVLYDILKDTKNFSYHISRD